MESEDFSIENTFPTDLSISFDEISDLDNAEERKRKTSKHLYERKQLVHDLQLLKIELSQKSLIIDNMKADHMQSVEDLEEKLSDAIHQKQLLQARLESQLKIQQEDARLRTEQIQKELDTILKRQHQLESTNEKLQEKAVDIRKSLQDLELTDNQYSDRKSRQEEELSLKDFVAMKLYELVKPWKVENEELKTRCRGLSEELHSCKGHLEKCQDELVDSKRNSNDLEIKHQRISLAFADVKSQVQHGNFKVENYDRVKSERDAMDQELTDLKKKEAYLETAYASATKERDQLSLEVSSHRQTIALLQKDKDFFSKQVSDLHNKLLYTEDRVVQQNEQLERTKQSREELYDKYVASRDQYKTEYENKLREELEMIRMRTNTEIDRLKTSTREMYERENRGLREARDLAISEKDRATNAEKEQCTKYESLLSDFRQLQMKSDNKMVDLHNDVKLKAFESERTQMVYEETCRNLKECQLENEKLQKKLEVLTKEYYGLQMAMEKRVSELESETGERKSKLETYERLEQELDDVVMQAAEVENEEEAERVLFSYGYGANVPTTSKRRLKQSVHLARRVLQLERANTSLRKEVERETNRSKELAEQVREANVILDQSQQPYHYLVESIRLRDSQVTKLKQHVAVLEGDLGRLQKETGDMSKTKNQMAADLERLLNQKEEMSVMKQVVLNLSNRQTTDSRRHLPSARAAPMTSQSEAPRSAKPVALKKSGSRQSKHTFEEAEKDTNMHKPEPTQFTVQHPPDWYKKLQQKAPERSKYSSITQAKAAGF